MSLSLQNFQLRIDELKLEDIESIDFSETDDVMSQALGIVLLRGIQVDHNRTKREKETARCSSKALFESLVNVAQLSKGKERFKTIVSILYYLKPESPVFARQLASTASSFKSIDFDELDRLTKYSECFMSYVSPVVKMTPCEHYCRALGVTIDGNRYMLRAHSWLPTTVSGVNRGSIRILLGCSTMDTIVFHPRNRYDLVLCLPGIRSDLITDRFVLDLYRLIYKEFLKECKVKAYLDLSFGYGDASPILGGVGTYKTISHVNSLLEARSRFSVNSGFDVAIHPHFSPINKRLLEFPSVFGIFPRDRMREYEIEKLRDAVRKASEHNTRDVFQEIFGSDKWMKEESLIHKHEIHMRLDRSLEHNVYVGK